MAVLDFFKKKPQDEAAKGGNAPQAPSDSSNQTNNPQSAGGPGQSNTSPGTSSSTTVQKTETTMSGGTGGGSYNGIGATPGGGQPYNGIGNPPAAAPTQSTTTTTTQTGSQAGATPPTPPTQGQGVDSQQATTATSASTPAAGQGQQAVQSTPAQTEAEKKESADKMAADTTTSGNADGTTPQVPDPAAAGMGSNIDTDKRSQLDLMTHLTQRSNRVFMTAQQKAKELQSQYVDSEHVLHGLLADPEIYKLFTEQKVQPTIVEQELEKIYKKGEFTEQPQPSPRVKRVLDNALVVARKLGYEFISPEHILLSLYKEGEGAGARTMAKLGIKEEDLNKKITGNAEGVAKDGKAGDSTGEKSASVLAEFTDDLTAKAEAGQLDPVVERSDVIERTIHIISRRTKNNPVLVGEAGVGKTAVVEGLAQKIASKEVPESLIGKRILQLDLMAILAGASHRGDFEERMKKIIEEISQSQGKIILFIDEIHNIVGAGAGGGGSLDASNFLKPSLARGELQMIGATTLTEYRKYIEKDPALERRFQPVMTPEPTVEQAIKMLTALKDKYEAFHRVQIPAEAIDAAAKLSKRYVGDRFLPDKAIDLIDEAASAVRLPLISLPEEIRSHEERLAQLKQELDEVEKRGDKVRTKILKPKIDDLEAELKEKQDEFNTRKSQTTTSVSEQSIKDIIARWTGIPVSKISESETEKLSKLEDIIHERLINQNAAVEPVAQAVRRGRAGLKSTKRPIGSFVFMGPTGVGKTELAKTLAEVLFGQELAMIRFDMTEYMEKHEVAKLLGAPPGYVGYEDGGKLTEAVRRRPYSVILFDEIEKAHPDIFNILLQILDDGRLTDTKGHTISFKNTVVICTSNIGTKMIQDEMMADGQVDIEEPTVISTYTYSPRGRQIMTIMGKVFEREGTGPWNNMMLIDYFAGQKIEEVKVVEKEDGTTEEKPAESSAEFPGKEFDTHVMSPQGVEIITVDDRVLQRTSTTAKVWNALSLIDYFKDGVVINALPDAPEQQLPTARLKTHAFSPAEEEIVSFSDRYWKRTGDDKNWETGALKDYFEGHTLVGADTPHTEASDTKTGESTNTSQDAKASQNSGNKEADSKKAADNNASGTPEEQTAQSTDTKNAQDNQGSDTTKPTEGKSTEMKASQPKTDQPQAAKIDEKPADAQKEPVTEAGTTIEEEEKPAFPTHYWDIHGFTPEGNEYIVVGEKMWTRDAKSTSWKITSLHEYFGNDFPLEKELEEKKKIEDELAKNQYGKVKVKVMEELRKFFRPELINRFDEVIIFEPLKYVHMLQIAELQLKDVSKLLEEQNIGLSWTDAARREIVRQGFDPIYGARPLKRSIQKLIENPISQLIIEKKLDESDLLVVDFDGDAFVFNIEHVSFVPASKKKKEMKKKFTCKASGHEFETIVAPQSTVICPQDGTKDVEEVKDSSGGDSQKSTPDQKPSTQASSQNPQGSSSQAADKNMQSGKPQDSAEKAMKDAHSDAEKAQPSSQKSNGSASNNGNGILSNPGAQNQGKPQATTPPTPTSTGGTQPAQSSATTGTSTTQTS